MLRPRVGAPRPPGGLWVSFILLSSLAGCATTFDRPTPEAPTEHVYLLEYSSWGHHSLAFHRDGSLFEFTYGDWELFALDRRDAWTAWKNMTFPTPGALGRKVVRWTPGEPICPLFVSCIRAVSFPVSQSRAQSLLDELTETYEAGRASEVFNAREAVFFVPHPAPYSFHHNCNHALVSWLEALGGTVSGRVFYKPTLIEGMRPKPG